MFLLWLCLLMIATPIYGQFVIPKLEIEAFTPAGFRVALEGTPGVQMFTFQCNINGKRLIFDVRKPSRDGRFVYDNPSIRLEVGDTVHYNIHIQHDSWKFRLDNQTWRVTELRSRNEEPACRKKSVTVVSNRKNVCSGEVIFEDDFSRNSLNTNKWLQEQYIPTEPDYEFNIYVKDPSVTRVRYGQLTIKPKIRNEDLKEEWLDLSEGCTRIPSRRAKCRNKLYLLHHPIASGRIVSKINFVYGEVEIRAKIPWGDWMYPEIYLEDENNGKLIIAPWWDILYPGGGYPASNDLELFGGPIINDREPDWSSFFKIHETPPPLNYDYNTYNLKWTAERLELYINNYKYSVIEQDVLRSTGFSSDSLKVRLVLGVGVGGIKNFPNGLISYGYNESNYKKPWMNTETKQMKKFYESRSKWEQSWYYGGELNVDYVKITAI